MLKYRLGALALIALGLLSIAIENDGTACAFIMMIAVPMLFCKKEPQKCRVK